MTFNNQVVRVGVVGVGGLGQHHARLYRTLPQSHLVGVVDPVLERREKVALECGCQSWADYEPLLELVDAVTIAVPTSQHATVAEPFLRRGIHVLIEKPITLDLVSAQLMVNQAQRGVLHVGHSERFNPALLAVQPFVKNPRFFEAHRLSLFTPRSLDVDVVLDLMIHDLDLITKLVQSPICEIRSIGIPVLTGRVDIANARLEFENGCVANLTASRVSREKVRKLRFFQPNEYVSLDLDSQVAEVFSMKEIDGDRKIVNRTLQVQREEPLKLEILAFLTEILSPNARTRKTRSCTGEEGISALELALEIVERMSMTV